MAPLDPRVNPEHRFPVHKVEEDLKVLRVYLDLPVSPHYLAHQEPQDHLDPTAQREIPDQLVHQLRTVRQADQEGQEGQVLQDQRGLKDQMVMTDLRAQ